jgi:acetylornithine deacetylase/succinyl-diaminopimelate desuccinylase-like protein
MRSTPEFAISQLFRLLRTADRARLWTVWIAIALPFLLVHPPRSEAQTDEHRSLVVKAPAPKAIDYDSLTREATTLLQQEVQINTTNPPGDELPVAKLLKEKLLADGIPATVWEPLPGRGVIIARMRGRGHHNRDKRALILLSHMDVVPADPKEWSVPPFSGEIKDGAIWGRGSIDDKGPGVIELMAMLALKRAGILLDRDVIFIATGDEEVGGAGWVVNHQADVFADAGYVLNEGGGIETRPNGKRYFGVSIAEKTPLWLRLTASGPGGDAAVPSPDNAVARLIEALARVENYQPPIHVVDAVGAYFKAIGGLDGGPPEFLDLSTALQKPDYAKTFLAVPRQSAMVRDTFTPTVLNAGEKTNVIPPTALAEIDSRLLPGEDPKQILSDIDKLIADSNIKVETLLNFPAVASPADSPLMTAIDSLAQSENAVTVPTMIAGFTDSHYFRQKGLVAYGFIPIELTEAEEHGVHGVDEHLPIKQLGDGIHRMADLLQLFGRE